MAIPNPYQPNQFGILGTLGAQQGLSGQDMLTSMLNGPQSVSNLGFGAQQTSKYDPNGYAQLYSNWVNQRLEPYMQQYGIQPSAMNSQQQQLQQLQAQIADMRSRLSSFYTDSGGGN